MDEIGAMNYVTEKSVLRALGLAKKGRVFSLAHILEDGMPVNWFHQDFIYSTFRSSPEVLEYFSSTFPNKNKISYTNVRMEMTDHTGTHIDGLNHAAIGHRFYNGVDTREVTTTRGTKRLGIETMPPLVSRGVLIDMTLTKKYDSAKAVSLAEIEEVLELERTSVQKGDTVLLYTGWERFWKKDNLKYVTTAPGIGVEAASWMISKHVIVVGADTFSVEVIPNEDPTGDGLVHQMLITKNGIHLIENMRLNELAREKVYEFAFVCLPLRIRGGTGSPIHPIAIA